MISLPKNSKSNSNDTRKKILVLRLSVVLSPDFIGTKSSTNVEHFALLRLQGR